MLYTHDELTLALRQIVDNAEHIFIQWNRIPALADHLRTLAEHRSIVVPAWANPAMYPDEFPAANTIDTIQFFFVMIPQGYQYYLLDDAGNPTLWQSKVAGKPRVGVHAQYACASRALRHGMNILDPDYLITMTLDEVGRFYMDESSGQPNLPDLPGRLARFQEVGRILKEKYQGLYASLLREANGFLFRPDGKGIVQRLITEFSLSYGDWPFCKLSVTPARMLYDRRCPQIPSSEAYLNLTDIRDPGHFEAGADVARPFTLIRLGILRVSQQLSQLLANRQPVSSNPRVYDEARAAAMLVCRELVRLSGLSSPDIGGELWATGFYYCRHCRPGISDAELPCNHKPVCRSYQGEYDLFDLAPMVGTGD